MNCYGGAIYSFNGKVEIYFSNFQFGSASIGGAIYLTSSDYEHKIVHSNFISNSADTNGGAIYIEYCPANFSDLVFSSNKAEN